MRAEGATVSVIGLGTAGDSDARFLEDVAALGGGRMFFNADAAQLPAIFAQETVAGRALRFPDRPRRRGECAGAGQEIAARSLDLARHGGRI